MRRLVTYVVVGLHAWTCWAAAWLSGDVLGYAQDHHGSWEWAAWALYGVSLTLLESVSYRLMRKAKCTKLHAEIMHAQRSKAKWS